MSTQTVTEQAKFDRFDTIGRVVVSVLIAAVVMLAVKFIVTGSITLTLASFAVLTVCTLLLTGAILLLKSMER